MEQIEELLDQGYTLGMQALLSGGYGVWINGTDTEGDPVQISEMHDGESVVAALETMNAAIIEEGNDFLD